MKSEHSTSCFRCGSEVAATWNYCDQCGVRSPSRRNAGFWVRAVAFGIDMAVVSVGATVLLTPVAVAVQASAADAVALRQTEAGFEALATFAVLILQWLYFAVLESSSAQATVGKRLLGLRVVDARGRRLSFQRAHFRYLARIPSAALAGLGYLMVGIARSKRGLHDRLAGTQVWRA